MKKIFACLVVIYSLMFTGCGATLKKLENLADELRLHNKNIARVTNEFHAAGKLSDTFHKGVLTANDKFSKALDGADAAIAAGKQIADKTEAKSALDYARRIIDSTVFPAFLDIGAAVFNVPPEVKAQLENILRLMRLAFASITALFAQAEQQLRPRELTYAD
jgi:hypothetical protein